MSSYDDTCSALAVALAARVPALLWGGPGLGKTSVVEQISSHHGWHLETVIASICDPTDFKGMPRDAGDRTVFSPPEWAMRISDAGGGVVFLDEISTAPPSVQAALLRPVLGGVVGDLELPTDTRFVAAANPPGQAADGWDLSAPLANRFVHLEWQTPASVISAGFVYGFAPISVPDIDPRKVGPAVAEALRSVGAFLTARSDLAHNMPDRSTDRGTAWPSPRSWEMGARLLGHASAAAVKSGVRQKLLSGSVGASAAREFLAWERSLDLPDIEAALAAGGVLELPSTPDKIVVVCGALAAAIDGDPTTDRCAAAVNGILVTVAEAGHVDLATVALRRIATPVAQSGATMSPDAVRHFGSILAKMGRIKGAS